MAARRLTLKLALARLLVLHGAPAAPPTRDPWEAILRVNVAYLVDDARREMTYRLLRELVGTSPEEILSARPGTLEKAIARGGMQPERRAEKLRDCARLALRIGLAALRESVRTDPAGARKLLERFPGIGKPGADELLLLARSGRTLAPESNGLRVLVRLGLAPERKDYAATYRDAQLALADELPRDPERVLAARSLLRRHGQEICKRSAPLCERCTLAPACPGAETAPAAQPAPAGRRAAAQPAGRPAAQPAGRAAPAPGPRRARHAVRSASPAATPRPRRSR